MRFNIWVLVGCSVTACGVPANGNEQTPSDNAGKLIERLNLKQGKWVSEVTVGATNLSSSKGSFEGHLNSHPEIAEDCLSDDTILHSDLLLPGISVSAGDCAEESTIASGTVDATLECMGPDKSYGAALKYNGNYSPEHIEGHLTMDAFSQGAEGRIRTSAKVVSRYAGACT